ncbi:hypothetical protein ACSU64_28020 [Bacillaceae bacterium C204]
MFITPSEIRDRTSFEEVKGLTDAQLEDYIQRADSWILRATNRDYTTTNDIFIQDDLGVATWLLVEYLWLWDNPELKEEMMGHDEVIRLGSFTVNKGAKPENGLTGVEELDSILMKYRFRPNFGLGFFSVLKKG